MYFTTSLLNEIRLRLALAGYKDSLFPKANLPLTGEEIVAIVQSGINKSTSISDIFKEYKGDVDDIRDKVNRLNATTLILKSALETLLSSVSSLQDLLDNLEFPDNTIDTALSDSSNNPVLNKVITEALKNYVTNVSLLEALSLLKTNYKGYYETLNLLISKYPFPEVNDWAIINNNGNFLIVICRSEGVWASSLEKDEIEHIYIKESAYNNLSSYKKNAIYFIFEDDAEIDTQWVLGNNLPIILS